MPNTRSTSVYGKSTALPRNRKRTTQLVSGDFAAPTASDLALPGMEPSFWQGQGHQLHPPAWFPVAPMVEHLAYAVARDPADLTAHTRRVLLCLRQPDMARLSGSLSDLFIALGTHGLGLRKRLLAMAEPRLCDDMRQRFRRSLTVGQPQSGMFQDNVHSVLAARPPGRPLVAGSASS